MRLPEMTELHTSRDLLDVFKGYNHNLRIGNGEFFDMMNLSSSHYPILSPRGKRGVYAKPTNPQGLVQYDSLCYVDGKNFVVNKNPVDMGLSEDVADCPKQLVRMGAYVIILPDKKYINLTDLTDFGPIEARIGKKAGSEVSVDFEMCKVDGSMHENVDASATEPLITEAMEEGKEDIPLWLDTSSKPHALKQYSKSMSAWTTIATTYVKLTFSGYTEESPIPFAEGDGVTIEGIEHEQLSDLNNTMIVWSRGFDYIVVTGICDELFTQPTGITVSRLMPNMDFVIEANNRLWGCKYGVALNGEVVNEIYASKLGDFKNWNCFAGISTDSYAATVGTDGAFTGAITHLGYPIFFKERYMHKVYGNYPANYQINTNACRGVQEGSHKSLAIVNEVLYYKSPTAICAYDGSLPMEISYALGDVVYRDAVAGGHGNKYYISMRDDSDNWSLFVYDAAKSMWHKEDSTRADAFCSCRGELYFIDNADKKIKTILGSGDETETRAIDWMAETGFIATDSPDHKYISKLNIRMSVGVGTKVYVFAEYDSSGVWELLWNMPSSILRSFTVPIKPKRCDHMRLRITGTGEAKIFSIAKTIEEGSDWK